MAMERDRVPPVPATAGRIGARVKRGDDPRLLTGRGRYVDDMTLPRLVHAAFVRSVHAHARLLRVDLDRARRAAGVVGVLTGDAVVRLCKPYRGVLLHYKGMKTGAMLPLALDRVRYVGEPIVVIAAESRAAADDAAALIDVDYEPLTRALTVWISTQVPHMMQAVLAELFGLREQRVRVVAPDVGGSFGIKIHVYQDDMAACALALSLGRPVKFVASRRESFVSDIHAREQAIQIEVAADGDGVLTAMRANITAAVGPYSAYPRS